MEIWKAVVEFEGIYEVSNLGKVKSLKRKWCKADKILKPTTKNGYLRLFLSKNGIKKNCSVHRLVGLSFLPLIDGKPEINHKNRIRNDNRLENLEWADDFEQRANCSIVLEAKYHRIYYDKNPKRKSNWCVQTYGKHSSNRKYKYFETEAEAIEYSKTL